MDTFRCLRLAYEAGRTGGTAPAVLNAANEVAVAAFLDGATGFLDVARIVEQTLSDGVAADLGYGRDDVDLEDVLGADEWARIHAQGLVRR
jgi:1-deoxy-D-xylulose-5-phosphate reductoisomerase